MIGYSRSLLADPDIALKVASGEPVRLCLNCNKGCVDAIQGRRYISCVLNAENGDEEPVFIRPGDGDKCVAVEGGGIAGCAAARVAARRGYRVTLFERAERLGGQIELAAAPPAIASGTVFNIGESTGCTESVAMILHKYIKVEIGRALLLSDIGRVLFAAYLYGPQTGMYCVLGLIGRSTIVDTAIESLNLRKECTVITSRPAHIRQFVTETLGRTATQQNATGVYPGEPRTMIMVALTRRQAGLLRDFLRREDPEAFLTIVNSSEIIGKGFQSI